MVNQIPLMNYLAVMSAYNQSCQLRGNRSLTYLEKIKLTVTHYMPDG